MNLGKKIVKTVIEVLILSSMIWALMLSVVIKYGGF